MSIMLLCIALHGAAYLFGINVLDVAISPYFVVYRYQLYRVISAGLFHASLMHIGFNMMSCYVLGASLERFFGTLRLWYLSLLTLVLSNLLYVAISMLLYEITGALHWLANPAVGYSGVLFGYALIESIMSPFPTRSVFGCFNVPTKLYPWVLLVLLSVLMPNISFLGHLCGILVGTCFAAGWLWWAMPSLDTFQRWDQSRLLSWARAQPSYVACPNSELDGDARASARNTFFVLYSAARGLVVAVCQCAVGAVGSAARSVGPTIPQEQPGDGYGPAVPSAQEEYDEEAGYGLG
eukprot:CAMPEP_0196781966 /NCGR_PEP_ID=MMETSP1104-20130614/10463_1 /TAXON_ID=33652 /ORGANISM="Cafeteria sp., Strain Caron Lab Isolate" /LENGTH=293 /DNA_ID=CAMNT_0042152197 /DNA_START=98 /DNA_END=975 /DNA_ORIENTATION=-